MDRFRLPLGTAAAAPGGGGGGKFAEPERHLALRAAADARPVAVWSPVAISQGPAAVLVAWGLLTTKVRHPDHHLGVGLLTTKVPRLGVGLRLGLGLGLVAALLCLGLVAVVYLLCLGLVAVAPCLGLAVAVASRPFRVRLGVPVAILGLAVCRRRRGAPRAGTLCCACRPRPSTRGCRRGRG